MSDQKTLSMPREIAGIRIPDSRIAREATELTHEVSTPVVYNHALRTFVFGALLAQAQGLKIDSELFYLAAVMHDLGLTDRFAGMERFEVTGADAADGFLETRAYPEDRRAIVWDAIALHTSIGIVTRKRPEIALVHLGAGFDVAGRGFDSIPPRLVEQTLEDLPRLGFKEAFHQAIVDTIAKCPEATMMTWLSQTAEEHVHGYRCPTFHQVLASAPFAE